MVGRLKLKFVQIDLLRFKTLDDSVYQPSVFSIERLIALEAVDGTRTSADER